MSIAYYVGENLYLNITNRCSARCDFCLRRKKSGYGDAKTLWLLHEPSVDEIMADAEKKKWTEAEEVVFCGFGEPTMRLDEMLKVANDMRERKPDVKLRLNTNGHGSLLAGGDITPLLNVFDEVSVSLNYPDREQYNQHCRPMFGLKTYDGIVEFITHLAKEKPKVTVTVLSLLDEAELNLMRGFAEELGVEFRVREAAR